LYHRTVEKLLLGLLHPEIIFEDFTNLLYRRLYNCKKTLLSVKKTFPTIALKMHEMHCIENSIENSINALKIALKMLYYILIVQLSQNFS